MDTLSDVCSLSKKHIGFRCMVPMDGPFFEYLFNRSPGSSEKQSRKTDVSEQTAAAGSALDFYDLPTHWGRVATAARPHPSTACKAPMDLAKSVVINGNDPGFMGPLCCPLTKANATAYVAQDPDNYWVTEKSDGIRVIFVSILAAQFPRWRLALGGGPDRQPRVVDLCLADMITVEGGHSELIRNPTHLESSQLRLTIGTHVLRRTDRGHVFTLVLRTSASDKAPEQCVHVLRHVTPRHFSFVFDRAMDHSYLLLEEYPLTELSLVILDAEMIVAQSEVSSQSPLRSRLFMAVFDLYAYQRVEDAGLEGPTVSRFATDRLTLLQRETMSSRLAALSEAVFRPLEAALTGMPESPSSFAPLQIPLLLKRMVKVAELSTFFASMERRVEEDGSLTFLFREYAIGTTKNDGFIFTPEYFDLVSGSQPKQLKWKWPEKLTVDWRVMPSQRGHNHYDVALFFRKKRQGSMPDDAGHTQYSRALRMENPLKLTFPSQGGEDGRIVECRFDPVAAHWILEKIRSEKREANSVVTVVSVLESLAEHVDLPSLCQLLGATPPDPHAPILAHPKPTMALSPVPPAASQATAPPCSVKLCKLVVRATQSRFRNDVSVVLQWSVKLPTVKNVITCNHRKVEECFGLGEPCPELDGSSRLKDSIMIALADAGGCYAWSNVVCDAFFDGASGRWGIVRLHPNMSSNDAFQTQVLDHLMEVAVYRAKHGTHPPLPPELNGPRETRRRCVGVSDGAAAADACLPTWVDALEVETNRHYAERARMLSHGKQQRSVLRRMNNFIKSVLINSAVDLARSSTTSHDDAHGDAQGGVTSSTSAINVLDLCCGRGGDLQKWKCLQPIGLLAMVDSCFEAVAEAASRYNIGAGLSTKVSAGKPGFPGIPARFYVRDCFEREGMKELLNNVRTTVAASLSLSHSDFDVVSCQFSMHYGFQDEGHVRAFLSNVADALRPGGVFIGTTVDDRKLMALRAQHGDKFGNALYHVDFSRSSADSGGRGNDGSDEVVPEAPRQYGEAYCISVEHSVESQVEYIVHWKPFVALAAEYGLSIVETNNFLEAYDLFVATPIGQQLLGIVVKETGGSTAQNDEAAVAAGDAAGDHGSGIRRSHDDELTLVLDEEEQEAVGLFRSFVFQRI